MNVIHRMRVGLLAALLVCSMATVVLASLPLPSQPPTNPPAPATARAARDLKVALLPLVNLSGEKDAKQRQDQGRRGDEELHKLFSERGFQLIGDEVISKALTDGKIDMSDEESHNRATLFRLGKVLGADYIVFIVITDVGRTSDGVKVKTKTWLLDIPNEKAILNATRQESQSRAGFGAGFDSGARRIRNTVAGCVRDTLKDFLKDYPVATK